MFKFYLSCGAMIVAMAALARADVPVSEAEQAGPRCLIHVESDDQTEWDSGGPVGPLIDVRLRPAG